MLAIYNGKEYVCRDYSLTGDGWYTKMVYGEECTEIRDITVFAEYNNESIQILYRSTEEVCVCRLF